MVVAHRVLVQRRQVFQRPARGLVRFARSGGAGEGDRGDRAARTGQPVEREGGGGGSSIGSISDPGYQVYFGPDGEVLVILLTGCTKKRQQRDIEAANEMWADYKRCRRGPR